MSIQTTLFNHLKNIPGWKTRRKIVAFAVDDYGNVRLHSNKAKKEITKEGLVLDSRFDLLDSLDTKGDYEQLFDTLGSVKDLNGNHAIFTTYALPCNVNFEDSMAKREYVPENLNITYERLSTEIEEYRGAFELMKEGINLRYIKPQFHGREHLNVNLFNTLIRENNPQMLINIRNFSMAKLPMHKDHPNVEFNQAFSFWKEEEVESHKFIIEDGLKQFEKVYGYKSMTFTPPAQKLHNDIFEYVQKLGLIGIDKERVSNRHWGEGKFQKERNYLGEQRHKQLVSIVRNCVFEPTVSGVNWIEYTLKQIEAAFFWNKPAIISSHRVNFCGNIDVKNREAGLINLKGLLCKIVDKWPEVEFISIDELVKEIKRC